MQNSAWVMPLGISPVMHVAAEGIEALESDWFSWINTVAYLQIKFDVGHSQGIINYSSVSLLPFLLWSAPLNLPVKQEHV